MHSGDVTDFLKSKENLMYDKMNEPMIMTHYLEILRYGSEALYPIQAKMIMKIIDKIEKNVTDEMINDLECLTDKELIVKYDLAPKTVSTKYVSVNVDDIKKTAIQRIDIKHSKEMIQKQYDEYERSGWI